MSLTLTTADVDAAEVLLFGTGDQTLHDSGQPAAELSDDDQLLIAALQAQPRGTWKEIADGLGISPSTAARRWERLHSSGAAWISAYPARLVPTLGFCWITASPNALRFVAARLAADPATYWLERLDGEFTFFAALHADSLTSLHAHIDELHTVEGVESIRMQTVRSVLVDGSLWQPRLAGPVNPHSPSAWTPDSASRPTRAADRRLFSALLKDGRVSFVELAALTGNSERTLRRRVPEMLATGVLSTRCDVSREAVGMPIGLFLSIRWTAQWPSLAGIARRIPGVRTVAGISGAAPFLLHFWLRSTHEADRILAALHTAIPDVHVERVDFSIRSLKRYGRFFSPNGRVSGVQDQFSASSLC